MANWTVMHIARPLSTRRPDFESLDSVSGPPTTRGVLFQDVVDALATPPPSNFSTSSNLHCPYLPLEIKIMIAAAASEDDVPIQGYLGRTYISKRLFSLRQTCKEFDSAAVFVFKKLVKREEYSHYTQLRLPPPNCDFAALEKVFFMKGGTGPRKGLRSQKRTFLADMVKEVVLVVQPTYVETTERSIHDHCLSVLTKELHQQSAATLADILDRSVENTNSNLQRYKKQNEEQRIFLRRSSEFELLLELLPNIEGLNIETKDYYFSRFSWDVLETSGFTRETNWKYKDYGSGITRVLAAMKDIKIKQLVLHRLDTTMLVKLHPRHVGSTQFFAQLQVLDLSMTRKNEEDLNIPIGQRYPGYYPRTMQGGLSRILTLAVSLRYLRISLEHNGEKANGEDVDDCVPWHPDSRGYSRWIEQALEAKHFPNLECFIFENWKLNNYALSSFLGAHKTTLKHITIKVTFEEDNWGRIVRTLKQDFHLRSASFIINALDLQDAQLLGLYLGRAERIDMKDNSPHLPLYYELAGEILNVNILGGEPETTWTLMATGMSLRAATDAALNAWVERRKGWEERVKAAEKVYRPVL